MKFLLVILFILNCSSNSKQNRYCDTRSEEFLNSILARIILKDNSAYCFLSSSSSSSSPFSIIYEKTSYSFLQNQNQQIPLPTIQGNIQSLTISPVLPTGLNFNSRTGEISGAATTIQNQTSYQIQAISTNGSSLQINLRIRVFGTTATRVYGQPNFTANQFNQCNCTNPTAATLYNPHNIIPVTDGLYVSEAMNARVLFFPVNTITASRVYGNESSFTSTATGVTATRFGANSIRGINLDKNNFLYISDRVNRRFLRFPPNTNSPDKVLGQVNFTSNVSATSATQLTDANDIIIDSNLEIYAIDGTSSRILYFPNIDSSATVVYGQPNFTSSTANNPSVPEASRLSNPGPLGLFLDKEENLYVADSTNH
jgi:hypothetical protein